jgi:hypothetical protein
MGIDINGAKFLFWSRSHGVNFGSTVTLGRQNLFLQSNQLEKLVLGLHGEKTTNSSTNIRAMAESKFAEPLFRYLGATEIQSIDANAYEDATIIHDMNLPIKVDRQFSCLFDGGTLEHVFNSLTSFENCMKLVRSGGHLIHILPANNFFGHGFYQFSAEFFYRLYGGDNGFRVKKVLLVEDCPGGRWLEVPDPLCVKRRITYSNVLPTNLYVLVEKVEEIHKLKKIPYQSDYEQISWEGKLTSGTSYATLRDLVRNRLPMQLGRTFLVLKHLLARNRDLTIFDVNKH